MRFHWIFGLREEQNTSLWLYTMKCYIEHFVTLNETNEFKVLIKFVFVKNYDWILSQTHIQVSIMNLTSIWNCGKKNLQFKHAETCKSCFFSTFFTKFEMHRLNKYLHTFELCERVKNKLSLRKADEIKMRIHLKSGKISTNQHLLCLFVLILFSFCFCKNTSCCTSMKTKYLSIKVNNKSW